MKQLFVIGLPRSGTSLLYKSLSSHSEIKLLYESDLYYSWPRLFGSIRQRGWGKKVDFWNGHLSRHGLSSAEIEALPKLNRVEAINWLNTWQGKDGAKVVGEKSALYSAYCERLHNEFPDAKFIILWRNLLEVFDSVSRASAKGDPYFSKKGLFYEYLGELERLQRGVQHLKSQGADIYELNFEELVNNKMASCQSMCDFLGLPFENEMLTGEGFDPVVIPHGAHHAGVKRGEIDSDKERGKGFSEQWEKRVGRYELNWSEKFGNLKRKNGTLGDTRPSMWEECICSLFYYLAKGRLHLTVFIYWLLPEKIKAFKKRSF